MRRCVLLLAAALLAGCSLWSGDRPCPTIEEDYAFWVAHAPFAEQARAEGWTLAQVCATIAETDPDVKGSAPFYYFTGVTAGRARFCYCPVR